MDFGKIAFDLASKPKTRGNVVTAIGDSITANNGPLTQRLSKGYLNWMSLLSQQRLCWQPQYGISGYRSDQILAECLPAVLARPELPNYCIVLAGTNDVGQSIPLTTTIANLTSMYDQLIARGVIPVACTIPPRPISSNMQLATEKINSWIRKNAQRRGYPLVDFHRILANPANGEYLSAYDSGDGVHPGPAGAKAMGNEIVRVLQPLVNPWIVPLSTANNNPANLLSNGLFLTDTNADGVPDGWTAPANSTCSLVDPVNGDASGKWFKISKTASASGTSRSGAITVVPGNKMFFAVKVKTAGIEAGTGIINLSVIKQNVGNTILTNAFYLWDRDIDIGTYYAEFTVPTDGSITAVQIDLFLQSGLGDVYIAQPTLVDMTAMGIA